MNLIRNTLNILAKSLQTNNNKTKSKKFYDKTRGHGVLFEQKNMLSWARI